MDWLFIVAAILATVFIALMFGLSNTYVKSRTGKVFVWVGCILVLLVIRFFDGQPFVFLALVFLAVLRSVQHIPAWLTYGTLAAFAMWLVRHVFVLLAESLREIYIEVERVHSRIVLLDSAVTAKLNDIARRLPEEDVSAD